jgi:cupin superfamily acireductone dioxygenase involved in methionine salvage
MSKGSKRRPGQNYEDNYERIFNKRGYTPPKKDDSVDLSKREEYTKPKTALDEKRDKFLSIHKQAGE